MNTATEPHASQRVIAAPFPELHAPLIATDEQASWRILLLLNVYRVLVPLVLLSLNLLITPNPAGTHAPALFGATLTAYLLTGITGFFSLKRRWPPLIVQAIAQLFTDVVAISLLTYASGGGSSGLMALMTLPLTAISLIIRPRLALLFTAVATIALLFQQGMTIFAGWNDLGSFTSVGLTGGLMFCLCLGAGYAATRWQHSEAQLKQRELDLANLAELNEFIVQHLRESILVVDAQDRVRLINESAAQLLKAGSVTHNTLLGELAPRLLYLLESWRQQNHEQYDATLSLVSADGSTLIQPHFVALESSRQRGPTLIFLEDTSIVAARVQQSKLAALGRLSASIAHEVRNPVGAMSHAAQLLSESPALTPQDRRLTDIITHNGERVSTIINNILQLSRRDSSHPERLSLNAWVDEFVEQFRQSFQLDAQTLPVAAPGFEVEVRFDASHLQQIVSNLCENALKYGSNAQAEITGERLLLRYGRIGNNNRPYLEIADRGVGIPTEMAEQIFEPFFTAGNGGTGLGLFIARELTHCNRAVLLYEPRHGGGSIFRIVFSDPQRWEI